jgi:NAD+ diphosphatase
MDISEAYRFCPLCGSEREPTHEHRPFRCTVCQHTSFFGPVAAVGAVISNQLGQVLLIERAKEPGRGKLGMPGGFVDPQESAEHGLRREIREEVGIEVGELQFLLTAPNSYAYNGIVNPVLDVFFHTVVVADQNIAVQSSEVSSWMWTDLHSGILDRMAFPSNRLALQYYLEHRDGN